MSASNTTNDAQGFVTSAVSSAALLASLTAVNRIPGLEGSAAMQVGAAVSSLAVAAVGFVYWRRERRRPTEEKVRVALGTRERGPWLVIGLFALALLTCELLIGAVFGLIAGEVAGPALTLERFAAAILPPTWVLLLLAAFPLAVFAAHRVASHPLLWVMTGVVVARLLSLGVGLVGGVGSWGWDAALGVVIFLVGTGIGAGLGVVYAERTREQFVVRQLFRALQPADRGAVLEMLREAVTAQAEAEADADAEAPTTPTAP